MSELTLTVLRLGLLALLWFFVFAVVGVLRGDLYGTRIATRDERKARSDKAAAAAPAVKRGRNTPGKLVVTEGSLRGTSLQLRGAPVLVGRNPECTLILDDDYASGRHARFFCGDEGWLVEDLGSTNGTYLDGQALTAPTAVRPGSELRIGRTVIEVRK